MNYLYFACGWVIRPDVDYVKLTQMAAESQCDLVTISPLYKSEQGYMVMTFAVRVPSEAWLVEFIKKVGVEYAMTHWYGVPEDYYARGQVFDVAQFPPHTFDTWFAGMQAYGQHNEQIKQKLENSQSS